MLLLQQKRWLYKNGKKILVQHRWDCRKLLSCNFLLAVTPETSYFAEITHFSRCSLDVGAAEEVNAAFPLRGALLSLENVAEVTLRGDTAME